MGKKSKKSEETKVEEIIEPVAEVVETEETVTEEAPEPVVETVESETASTKTLKSESSELAMARARALDGLGRKDRAKISEINSKYHVDSDKLVAKYQKIEAEKKAKADAKAPKRNK
jgi:hypothetical protein